MESCGSSASIGRLRLVSVDGITQAESARELEVIPVAELSPARCVQRAMAQSVSKRELSLIRHGWPNLDAFVKRLSTLLTDQLPAADPERSALQEALEAACLHFHAAAPSAPPILGAARFMAAGVSSAARGLLTYNVEAVHDDGQTTRWCIQHGLVRDFVASTRPTRIRCAPRVARPDERHAMKTWVMNQLLFLDDHVLLGRANVDARTFEPY